jgi:hypothetical protein
VILANAEAELKAFLEKAGIFPAAWTLLLDASAMDSDFHLIRLFRYAW